MHKAIPVLFEDEDYIVFEKPSGMLVVPSPRQEQHTLESIVNRDRKTQGPFRLWPCHRLDRDTSGAILFAKGKSNQRFMTEAFKHRQVKKTYLALVQGRLKYPAGEIKSKIKDQMERRWHRKGEGKLATTRYKVLSLKKNFSILEVYPLTGRTHQIRIQLSEIGHPLLGERLYALGRDYDLKFPRTALHASRLEWFHPKKKKMIAVDCPLPKDMEQFIERN